MRCSIRHEAATRHPGQGLRIRQEIDQAVRNRLTLVVPSTTLGRGYCHRILPECPEQSLLSGMVPPSLFNEREPMVKVVGAALDDAPVATKSQVDGGMQSLT